MKRNALFSDDRAYRFRLDIVWDECRPLLNFLMLNPSIADEISNDPTVDRCMKRAMMWGYGGVVITNIFALKATDPEQLYITLMAYRDTSKLVGAGNDGMITNTAFECEATIAGWGNHGKLCGRGEYVKHLFDEMEKPLFYLKMSNQGQPYHPLYLPYSLGPEVWI